MKDEKDEPGERKKREREREKLEGQRKERDRPGPVGRSPGLDSLTRHACCACVVCGMGSAGWEDTAEEKTEQRWNAIELQMNVFQLFYTVLSIHGLLLLRAGGGYSWWTTGISGTTHTIPANFYIQAPTIIMHLMTSPYERDFY